MRSGERKSLPVRKKESREGREEKERNFELEKIRLEKKIEVQRIRSEHEHVIVNRLTNY